MAGVAPQPGHRQSNSHIVALLSLKVLLLAFFILLNSLATFQEERRSAVVESVRDAFRGLVPAALSLGAAPAAVGVLEGGEDVVEALARLFGDDLPLVERAAASGARVLQVDLAVGDLFAGDSERLAPEGAETLRLIAAVLADPRFADEAVRIDVLYGLDGRASGLADNRLALLRAGALVRALEQAGVAPPRLSAGLLPSFAGEVRLHFTIEAAPAESVPAEPVPGGEG